ncbi:hypothetical protein Mpsy_2636 [Methanolobus psychrophilus R15]|nr:hypothetical protein Mpsy_2636 [Methanolobus psychrophilus R15]
MRYILISFWPAIKNESPLEAMKKSSNNYVTEGLCDKGVE